MKYNSIPFKFLFSMLSLFSINLAHGQFDRVKAKEEFDYFLKSYAASSVDTLRGINADQWNEQVQAMYTKINRCSTMTDYYKTYRYFGYFLNDDHADLIDYWFYNRELIFDKQDTIFPIWTKTWKDGSTFVVKDYSNTIPTGSEIISINNHVAKDLANQIFEMKGSESRYARSYTKMQIGIDHPLSWLNFTNHLYFENIKSPYTVKYKLPNDTNCQLVVLNGMNRKSRFKQYKSDGDKKRVDKSSSYKQIPLLYTRRNNNIGVLDINLFWGKNPLNLMFGSTDSRYCKLLDRAMKQIEKDNLAHLIIDLRDNPGGYLGNIEKTLDYFTNKPYSTGMVLRVSDDVKKTAKPLLSNIYKAQFGKTENEKVAQSIAIFDSMPNGSLFRVDTLLSFVHVPKTTIRKFQAKVYILTNASTYSASIIFCNLAKSLTIGKLVGEAPGGFTLQTGGTSVRVHGYYATKLHLTVPYMLYTPPSKNTKTYEYLEMDDPIEQSLTDWLQSKDTSLEQLIQLIEQSKI